MFREWLNALWFRIRSLGRRRRLEQDLDDELQFHLAMSQQKLVDQGMPPEEARYAARRARLNPQRFVVNLVNTGGTETLDGIETSSDVEAGTSEWPPARPVTRKFSNPIPARREGGAFIPNE